MSTLNAARLSDGRFPLIALGFAVLAGSTGAILVRWSAEPSIVIAFYRMLFTTLLLLPVAVGRHREDLKRISGRDLVVVLATGVALAVHFAAWMESLQWTSVAASAVLTQTQVLFVAIGAVVLLDERLTGAKLRGIGLAFGSVSLMSVSSVLGGQQSLYAGPRPLYGNALALLGAIGLAGYLLAGRSLRQRIHLFPYVLLVYGTASLVLLGVALSKHESVNPAVFPLRELALFLTMAVVPGIFGHTVLNWALKHVESSVASVSFLGAPLGNTVLAFVLLNETPGLATLVGGLGVIAGIYQMTRARDGSES